MSIEEDLEIEEVRRKWKGIREAEETIWEVEEKWGGLLRGVVYTMEGLVIAGVVAIVICIYGAWV